MLNRQNFETIDKIQVSKHEYLRLIHFTGENPEHYVVAKYHVDGHKATNSTVIDLMACEHFIGDTAEVDAESYTSIMWIQKSFPRKTSALLRVGRHPRAMWMINLSTCMTVYQFNKKSTKWFMALFAF